MGRLKFTKTLEEMLSKDFTYVAITGISGIGKTDLVCHYFSENKDKYDLNFMIDCNSKTGGTIKSQLIYIANRLNINVNLASFTNKLIAETIYSKVSTKKKIFLFFDSAKDNKLILDLLPYDTAKFKVIISSQNSVCWDEDKLIKLDFEDEEIKEDSINYVRNNLPNTFDLDICKKIAKKLGFNIKIIRIFIQQIKSNRNTNIDFSEVKNLIENYDISNFINILEKNHIKEAEILFTLSLFGNSRIDRKLIKSSKNYFSILSEKSLISGDENYIFLHKLVKKPCKKIIADRKKINFYLEKAISVFSNSLNILNLNAEETVHYFNINPFIATHILNFAKIGKNSSYNIEKEEKFVIFVKTIEYFISGLFERTQANILIKFIENYSSSCNNKYNLAEFYINCGNCIRFQDELKAIEFYKNSIALNTKFNDARLNQEKFRAHANISEQYYILARKSETDEEFKKNLGMMELHINEASKLLNQSTTKIYNYIYYYSCAKFHILKKDYKKAYENILYSLSFLSISKLEEFSRKSIQYLLAKTTEAEIFVYLGKKDYASELIEELENNPYNKINLAKVKLIKSLLLVLSSEPEKASSVIAEINYKELKYYDSTLLKLIKKNIQNPDFLKKALEIKSALIETSEQSSLLFNDFFNTTNSGHDEISCNDKGQSIATYLTNRDKKSMSCVNKSFYVFFKANREIQKDSKTAPLLLEEDSLSFNKKSS